MVEKQSGLPVYIESVNSSNLRSVMDVSRSEAKLAGVMGNPCQNLGRDQMRPRVAVAFFVELSIPGRDYTLQLRLDKDKEPSARSLSRCSIAA